MEEKCFGERGEAKIEGEGDVWVECAMVRAGIVGLPNVGKSTLFNAVTRTRKAQAANYPFCTIEPNVGMVTVPDTRLDWLAKMSGSEKILPASIELVDIAGLVKGASQGEGLGNQFLTHIRLDRAKGIVRRLRFPRASDRIEKCALAHIWKPHDASTYHRALYPHIPLPLNLGLAPFAKAFFLHSIVGLVLRSPP